jgi:hypothetical protein
MASVSHVHIYAEPRRPTVDFDQIAGFVRRYMPAADVDLRGPMMEEAVEKGSAVTGESGPETLERLSRGLAAAKVRDMERPVACGREPLAGEVDYERRRLLDGGKQVFGLLYDGHLVCGLLRSLIGRGESGAGHVHLVFTNQLMGTWDEGDRRYHARTVLMGSPALVSISGLVEAPARSRGYYLARRAADSMGMEQEARRDLAEYFDDEYLTHDDGRLTEVAKGYALQPLVYRMTGEAFCEDPGCRLFNAHWQREMLRAQTGEGKDFCARHEDILRG